MKKLFIFALLGALTTSCVSTKVHKTLQEKYDLLSNEADQLRQKSEMRAAENSELERTLGEVRREVNQLQEDTTAKFDELAPRLRAVLTSLLLAEGCATTKSLPPVSPTIRGYERYL